MAKVTAGVPYKIISSVNFSVLDVLGGQPKDRIPIVPYKWGGRANQIWVPEKLDSNENIYVLTSMAGKSYVMDNSEREQGRVLMFSKHGRENQQWRFTPIQPGAFNCYIENVKDGKVLELSSDGRDVRLVTKNLANTHQRWIISEA